MQDEITTLETNHNWFLTDLPSDKTTIGCRWVYKIKYNADGSIERYKARLVVKGYTQLEGVDFLDTFSLVAKLTTVRLLLALVTYLTTTRPDIAFAVQHLSQFVSSPTTAHHQATFRVLRYLKGTPGLGVFLSAHSSLQLKAFSDFDWAGCVDSRRSITGFSVYLGSSLISWHSKKKTTVSKSSSEAEYRALASTTCELQWITYLLEDLRVPFV
uniref:Reverse transcriptase Ty1/copia-type domain-containing protein n=1 Tax=Cajanus cajan TaxID=3821 RepID=A0A151T7D0_CAJCA|nr:hypothetical protein KK1_017529 [Cajanus cajan]